MTNFTDWWQSLPDKEPGYQEAFEAGRVAGQAQAKDPLAVQYAKLAQHCAMLEAKLAAEKVNMEPYGEIIELAIRGHASTREAMVWAIQQAVTAERLRWSTVLDLKEVELREAVMHTKAEFVNTLPERVQKSSESEHTQQERNRRMREYLDAMQIRQAFEADDFIPGVV